MPRPPLAVRGSATCSHLLGELEVGVGAGAVRVVVDDRQAEARRLADRTLRGITVSKTSSGKCWRTSRSTSCARRVRPSCIVSTMPATVSLGLSSRWISESVSSRPASPSSAKYSVCTGTMTRSAATSALTVSGPSDGGQSRT